MMETQEKKIEAGDLCIITDADDLSQYGIKENDLGMVNAVVFIDGDKLIYFMPKGSTSSYVISAKRVDILDEDHCQMCDFYNES
jgi:hypothetical protein